MRFHVSLVAFEGWVADRGAHLSDWAGPPAFFTDFGSRVNGTGVAAAAWSLRLDLPAA